MKGFLYENYFSSKSKLTRNDYWSLLLIYFFFVFIHVYIVALGVEVTGKLRGLPGAIAVLFGFPILYLLTTTVNINLAKNRFNMVFDGQKKNMSLVYILLGIPFVNILIMLFIALIKDPIEDVHEGKLLKRN